MTTYKCIGEHYEKCFEAYGDTSKGLDWPNEEDMYKRYDVMLDVITDNSKEVSLLDFGCGTGRLFDYIQRKKLNIKYSGLDISKKYYNYCKEKFPNATFYNIDIMMDNIDILPTFDYVVMNGVFTEKREMSEEQMFSFMTTMLKKIYPKLNNGIAFNVMSPIVDFKRDDLFYLSYDRLGFFLKDNLSRNYIINANYGLWEYTTYVYKQHK